jgi:hypothetical protein
MTENINRDDEEPKKESSLSSSSRPPPPPSILDSSSTTTTTSSPSLVLLGQTVANASDWINENLITVRYSVMATIGLLTLYGVSQTPLFFRYMNVADIPASQFVRQKSLSCRLIQIHQHQLHQESSTTSRMFKQQQGNSDGKRQRASSSSSSSSFQQYQSQQVPLQMWVRHLSPVESWLFLSILPTSWFDWYLKMHPQQTAIKRLTDDQKSKSKQDHLLLVQVAGIDTPLSSSSHYGSSTPWLTGTEWIQRNLLENKQQSTLLTCQLLERQRLLPRTRLYAAEENVGIEDGEEDKELDVAVVKVYFRQPNSSFQFFSTDLARHMVRNGIANPAPCSYDEAEAGSSSSSRRSTTGVTVDTEKLKQQQQRYQEMLHRAEMDAAKEARGMWSDPLVRQERRQIMDEVEFQTSASTLQKLWRWMQKTWQQRQRQESRNRANASND